MEFAKYHGLGNDFVLVDATRQELPDFSRAARAVCDRRFGIGADGLILLWPLDKENVKMRIFNSDGSEAEMCGNASRCVPLFLQEKGFTTTPHLTLHTLAGPIVTDIIDPAERLVRVDMGVPRLTRGEIPVQGNATEKAIEVPLEVNGQSLTGTAVSMGNPHFVIFVPDISQIALEKIGPQIETHPFFPRKTNVEFVQVIDEHTLRMRVWERGAGITQACGTGACATLVAAVLTGHSQPQADILLDGGTLHIEWPQQAHVWMTGPAQKVYEGVYTGNL